MGSHFDARHIAAISILLCACTSKADLGDVGDSENADGSGDETSGSTGSEESTADTTAETGDNPPMPGVGPAAVDILFVIDNSGSMGEEQGNLQASIGGFVQTLDTSGLDYRIAVTTTDNGNYWCRGSNVSAPEAGNFVFSTCRNRLDDFYFASTDTNVEDIACTDHCSVDMLATTNGVPWIENGGSNLPVGIPVADALRCVLPQGINGCGFEQHLESTLKALKRMEVEGENELGFMRPDAHLMIVFLTDEVDCSYNTEWETIFMADVDGGNEVFWTLPDEPSPTSGLCWNAGVQCTGGPGTYDDCQPQDYDFEGTPTTDPNRAVFYTLSRYQDHLDGIKAAKAASHAQVFVFGILGVPENYPSTRTIVYADAAEQSPDQIDFGIGPGCSSENGRAAPPVRLRKLMEDNALTDASPIHSICAPGFGSALTAMVNQVTTFVGP